MNKIITLFLILILGASISNAQNSQSAGAVEESLYGVQIGILGVWGYNESKLADQFSLRTEIGFDASLWGGTHYENSVNYALIPLIKIEPRWYYNIKKRGRKGRNTWNNGANYLSLETTLHTDLFVISNDSNHKTANTLDFIPKWGIKRNIGQHFGFEIAIGPIGYGINLDETSNHGYTGTFDLKIGYNF